MGYPRARGARRLEATQSACYTWGGRLNRDDLHDMSPGRSISGVRIENPFVPEG